MSGDPYADVGQPAFADTGQPGTPAQQQTYLQAHKTGVFDRNAPVGSAKNPYGLRAGDQPPANAYFVDMGGQIHAPGPAAAPAAVADPYADVGEQKASIPLDMLKAIPPGLAKGAAMMSGAGGDMVNFLAPGGGGYHLLLGAAQDLSGSDLGQSYWGGDKAWGGGVHGRGDAHPEANVNWAHRLGLFTSDDGNKAYQDIGGKYYEPQTTPGRYVESMGEYAIPAALGGETLVQRLAGTVLPGAASQFGEDTFHSPVGRLAGGVAGLGAAHMLGSALRSPAKMLGDTLGAVTPEQQQMATELMQEGAGRGVRLTFPEAIQQVTGGATGAGRLQRVVESTPAGQEQLAPMFAQRPDQVRAAVMSHADTLAPPSTAPSVLAADTRDAATNILRGAEGQRTVAVDPFYRAADPQTVPDDEVSRIITNLHDQAGQDKTGLVAGPLKNLADLLTDKPATQKALADYDAAMAARKSATAPADAPAPGMDQALADVRTYNAGQTGSLFSAIRARGGVKLRGANGSSLAGPDVEPYVDGVRMPGLVNNTSGLPGERMAQSLADEGWFGPDPGDPFDAFSTAFQREARGSKVYHPSAYAPDFKQRMGDLEREMSDAGIAAADKPQDAARKLWELRNGDAAERAAVQAEGSLNDPDAAEFDRLSAPPQQPGSIPITDIANLDRVRKAVRDRIELGFAPVGREPLVKEQSAALGAALQDLDDVMERHSPDFLAGKQTYQRFTNEVNRPLEAGPLGRMSNGQPGPAALYPSQPPEGTAAETALAARLLAAERPGLPDALTRQHVVNTFNEASQDNLGGPNQWGGAKWYAQVQGNPEQRAALAAGYSELPQGAEKLDDLERLSRVLQATGQRLGVGSNTAEKLTGMEGLKVSKAGKAFRDFSITEPLSFLGHAADAAAYRMRMNALVRMLQAGPEEIQSTLGNIDLNRNFNRGTLSQLLLQAPEARAAN